MLPPARSAGAFRLPDVSRAGSLAPQSPVNKPLTLLTTQLHGLQRGFGFLAESDQYDVLQFEFVHLIDRSGRRGERLATAGRQFQHVLAAPDHED